MRIKKQWVLNSFEIFCRHLGKRIGYQKGDWHMNYCATYGGWIIVECCESGGERHPMKRERLSNREMLYALDMAIVALQIKMEGE